MVWLCLEFDGFGPGFAVLPSVPDRYVHGDHYLRCIAGEWSPGGGCAAHLRSYRGHHQPQYLPHRLEIRPR